MISCERQKTWKASGILLALGTCFLNGSIKKERACMAFNGFNMHNKYYLSE